MQKENAFWREVIDYLPSLIFLFRIDEQERAHLIFCNNKVQQHLGYTAKEYVLAFEEDEVIHGEVQHLVDQIARRSHDVDSRIQPKPCRLTHKEGNNVDFYFQFRLFKTRSAQTNMLAVELKPVEMIEQLMGEPEVKETEPTSQQLNETYYDDYSTQLFVVESPVMDRLLDRMDRISHHPLNVVFQGEPSVGKRTLADALADLYSDRLNAHVVYFDDENEEVEFQEKQPDKPEDRYILLRIDHLDKLQNQGQRKLLNWLDNHQDQELIIVGTAEKPLDSQESRFLDSNLFYQLSFYTLPVPPLRHRPEDVRAVARKFLDQAAEALQFERKPYDETYLEQLTQNRWEGNFSELFSALRSYLLKGDAEDELHVPEIYDDDSHEDESSGIDRVITFDEMNRRYLSYVLRMTEGKIYGDDGAAALLGLKPTTLQSKLKKLGIK